MTRGELKVLPEPLPPSLGCARVRYRMLRGNPPISPGIYGWEVYPGRATTVEEKVWLKERGYRFGRFAWVLDDTSLT